MSVKISITRIVNASAIATLLVVIPNVAVAEDYGTTPLHASEIFAKNLVVQGHLTSGTFREVSQTDGGGEDLITTTYRRGRDLRETTTGGGFETSSGTFSGKNWHEDADGVVTVRADFRAKENPNALALADPDDPKNRVRVLGVTQSTPKEYAIEVNPEGGVDTYLYYDTKTFLMDRQIQFAHDGLRHVIEYSDYRRTGQGMVAYRIHSYDGRPANDRVKTVLSDERVADPIDFSIPVSRKLYSVGGTAPLTLPARFTERGIVVRANIDGHELDFLLDSGASGLFIDPGVAHDIGLTTYGKSRITIGGGDVDMGLVRVPHMSIGPLTMNDVVFTTTPYSEQADTTKVVGLIGFDFISSGLLEIDFKSEAVRVYPRVAFNPNALGLVGVPAQLDDDIPRVRASIEGVPGNFLFDTGADEMILYANYAQRLPSARVISDAQFDTVGGTMNADVREVSDFIFADADFKRSEVLVPSAATFDISDYDGIIGRSALSYYRVFFDYENNMLWLSS